eukprot:15461897-Alexandrium_andersonii.AAC.1
MARCHPAAGSRVAGARLDGFRSDRAGATVLQQHPGQCKLLVALPVPGLLHRGAGGESDHGLSQQYGIRWSQSGGARRT